MFKSMVKENTHRERELDKFGTPTFTSKSESKVSNSIRDIPDFEKRALKNLGDFSINGSIPEEIMMCSSPISLRNDILSEKSGCKSIHLKSNEKINEESPILIKNDFFDELDHSFSLPFDREMSTGDRTPFICEIQKKLPVPFETKSRKFQKPN